MNMNWIEYGSSRQRAGGMPFVGHRLGNARLASRYGGMAIYDFRDAHNLWVGAFVLSPKTRGAIATARSPKACTVPAPDRTGPRRFPAGPECNSDPLVMSRNSRCRALNRLVRAVLIVNANPNAVDPRAVIVTKHCAPRMTRRPWLLGA
jgi:hypothetical protein